jgi:hypothetical protein
MYKQQFPTSAQIRSRTACPRAHPVAKCPFRIFRIFRGKANSLNPVAPKYPAKTGQLLNLNALGTGQNPARAGQQPANTGQNPANTGHDPAIAGQLPFNACQFQRSHDFRRQNPRHFQVSTQNPPPFPQFQWRRSKSPEISTKRLTNFKRAHPTTLPQLPLSKSSPFHIELKYLKSFHFISHGKNPQAIQRQPFVKTDLKYFTKKEGGGVGLTSISAAFQFRFRRGFAGLRR